LYTVAKEKKKRIFVTLMYHLPLDMTINPRFINGTDLCVYDGVVEKAEVPRQMSSSIVVDLNRVEKGLARQIIKAMPRRF
jgi:hypothetical protein